MTLGVIRGSKTHVWNLRTAYITWLKPKWV